MPWVGKEVMVGLNDTISRLAAQNEELKRTNVSLLHDIDLIKVKWDYDLLRAEKLELENARLAEDFKSLVARTVECIPSKLAPEFDKDPFAEDETQTVTYLSPDPDDLPTLGEEILRVIEEVRLKDAPLSG